MKHTLTKRIAACLLSLCLLVGMLPTSALAAESGTSKNANFGITLADADHCVYRHGDDVGVFNARIIHRGRGAYCEEGNVNVYQFADGLRIGAKERAHFKNSDILLQPFTIDVPVPAYTSYTITYDVYAHIQRNSKGKVWYWLELFKAPSQDWSKGFIELDGYNAENNSNKSNSYSVGRSCYSNENGGTVKHTFTLTLTNTTGKQETIHYPMAYYVGASKSGSLLESYFHQTESYMEFYETNRVETKYVAKVNDQFYPTLSGAVSAFNNGSGNLTLLDNVSDNVLLTSGGTVDLGGKTLTGFVIAQEDSSSGITIQNGTVDARKANTAAITHTGSGSLTLYYNMTAKAGAKYYGVNNTNMILNVGHDVTIEPSLYAGGYEVYFSDSGPTINAGNGNPQIYLSTLLTLGEKALDKKYTVKFNNYQASAEHPMNVMGNWVGGDPEDHFTDSESKYHFFVTDDTTQYVVARPYKVTFDAGEGGTVSPETATIKDDGTAAVWPTPTKTGYTFNGWQKSDGTTANRGDKFSADVNLTASWKIKDDIRVALNANGGTIGTNSVTVTYDGKYSGLAGNTPTRDNYTFAGWFTAERGGTQVTEDTTVTQVDDHTLYARWTRNLATVTFDYNYGNSKPGVRTVYAGDPVGNLPKLTRTGFDFVGWFTAPEGGDPLTAEQVVSEDTTYYAHWTVKKTMVTVTCNANGGEFPGGATTQTAKVARGEAYSGLPTPTRVGYNFAGWRYGPNGGETAVTVPEYAFNHTLYAYWKPQTVNVTFKKDTDDPAGTVVECAYGEPYSFPSTVPTKEGKNFAGWYTAAGDSGTQVTTSTIVNQTSGHTLYAHWNEKHEHTIGVTGDPVTVNFDQSFADTEELAVGSYCLDEDITIRQQIKINDLNHGTINLCLNGHTLTFEGITNPGFFIKEGTLNICDCKGTGQIVCSTGILDVNGLYGDCVVNLYGGTFTASSAACVTINGYRGNLTVDGAAFNGPDSEGLSALSMSAGKATIQSGTLSGYTGASVDSNAMLTVEGGTIAGSGSYGINGKGTITVNGGTISSNSTHGIYKADHYSSARSLTVSGGSISGGGQESYGIYYEAGKGFTLTGSPTISSIYLGSQQELTIEGELQGIFPVHASGASYSNSTDITGSNTKDETEHFIPIDTENYHIKNGYDNVVQLCKGSSGGSDTPSEGAHTHPVCGKECSHSGEHSGAVEFKKLTTGETLTSGSYYLEADTEIGRTTIPSGETVELCLNGYTLTGLLQVRGTLSLCDCDKYDNGCIVPSNRDSYYSAITIYNGGELNQYGGAVKSGAAKSVDLQLGGTWNFYAGTVGCSGFNDPKVVPMGTLNLLDESNVLEWYGGYIELTSNTKPIYVGARPSSAYKVKTSGSSITYPLTIATGLPNGAAVSAYFEYTGDQKVALDVIDGKVILRQYQFSVNGSDVLEVDQSGKLTSTQLASEPWEQPGYIWDGYYTTPDFSDGTKITTDTELQDSQTIYPHWNVCGHGDNTADKNVVTEPTCTTEGTQTFTCSACGMTVTEVIPAVGHSMGDTWQKDEAKHWKVCARDSSHHTEEAPHTWGNAAVDETGDNWKYTCTVCNASKTEVIPKYTVTYVVDDYTSSTPNKENKKADETVALPAGLTRTGYKLAGWILLDEMGAPVLNADGTEPAPLTGQFKMPARDVTFQILWEREEICQLQPGQTIILEDGTSIKSETNGEGGTVVTITQPGTTDEDGSPIPGQKTEITLPNGTTTLEVSDGGEDAKDKVNVPAGSTVVTTPSGSDTPGPKITIGDSNGTVDSSGAVEAPVGSKVETTTTDSEGKETTTTITITGNTGGVIGSDGNVTFPPERDENGNPLPGTTGTVTVEKTDSTGTTTTESVTVDGETEGVDITTGEVPKYVPEINKIQIGDTIITVPEEWAENPTNNIKEDENGSAAVPAGSQLEIPDGNGGTTTITLPPADEGGTGGNGGSVNSKTGDVTIPAGGSASVTNDQGHTTTVTVPEGGSGGNPDTGTIKPGGSIDLPAGGTVSVEDGKGTTTVTIPEGGGTISTDDKGNLVVPGGSTITKPNGDTEQIPEGEVGTITPGGNIADGDKPITPSDGDTYPPVIEQPEYGNVTVSPSNPQSGNTVVITVTPEDGYQPETVTVTDSSGKPIAVTKNEDGTYSFIQPEGEVRISVTMGLLTCPKDESCPIHAFADASTTAWYHDGVHYCLINGLMVGSGNGKFGPSDTLTRGMLAQTLYNKEGKPAVTGTSPFEDVTEGAWYADAVIWAAENEIVTGYGSGKFGPNDPITREQLATILWRYARNPESTESLGKFTDGAKTSDWAVPALNWAVEQKIVSGKGNGILDPKGKATRAEVAMILMRYCKLEQ